MKAWEKLLKQWRGLELAKARSFKGYLYRYGVKPDNTIFVTSYCLYCENCCRLAQFILAREDPQETFLKSIPKQLASLSITYPVMQLKLHDRGTPSVQATLLHV